MIKMVDRIRMEIDKLHKYMEDCDPEYVHHYQGRIFAFKQVIHLLEWEEMTKKEKENGK